MLSLREKIVAARALQGWSQSQLAEAAGLGVATVQGVEAGKGCNNRSEEKLIRAFNREGIVITDEGISKPDATVTHLTGDRWFVELLEDAYLTLLDAKDKEILIFGGNNRLSPPDVIAGFRRLRQSGVRIREMVKEGDDYLMGPETDYRWIPTAYFENFITVVYANKVVNDFGTHGVLLTNKDWANAERKKFNLHWDHAPELTVRSTANVRY